MLMFNKVGSLVHNLLLKLIWLLCLQTSSCHLAQLKINFPIQNLYGWKNTGFYRFLIEMLLCRTTFGVSAVSNDALLCLDGDVWKSWARLFADGTMDGDENSNGVLMDVEPSILCRAPDGVVDRLMALWMPFMVAVRTLDKEVLLVR